MTVPPGIHEYKLWEVELVNRKRMKFYVARASGICGIPPWKDTHPQACYITNKSNEIFLKDLSKVKCWGSFKMQGMKVTFQGYLQISDGVFITLSWSITVNAPN